MLLPSENRFIWVCMLLKASMAKKAGFGTAHIIMGIASYLSPETG